MYENNVVKFKRYEKPDGNLFFLQNTIPRFLLMFVVFGILIFSILLLIEDDDTDEDIPCEDLDKKVTALYRKGGPYGMKHLEVYDKSEPIEAQIFSAQRTMKKTAQDILYTKKDVRDGKISKDEFEIYILSLKCLLSDKEELEVYGSASTIGDVQKQIMKLEEKLKAANQR
jgi:hypothetical protein